MPIENTKHKKQILKLVLESRDHQIKEASECEIGMEGIAVIFLNFDALILKKTMEISRRYLRNQYLAFFSARN